MTISKCKLEILRTLGAGGMATAYLALLGEAGGGKRLVAVKKPHAFLAADEATLTILEDEARLGASIRHPNVVSIIDFVSGDEPALVMEWVEGVDLARLVRAAAKTGRRLPVDVVAAIVRDALAGLHAAHESRRADGLALDIVHCDVSPQNVLVGIDGMVRVTDFGVAKAAWRQQHPEHGSITGKLRYLAPEQLSGACDRRADIYSAGVVLWELLTGGPMRSGEGVEMLVEILCSRARAPSATAADAACLDAVVLRALEHYPEERFATAAEMASALESAVQVASPERVAEIVRAVLDEADERVETVRERAAHGRAPAARWRCSSTGRSAIRAGARADRRARYWSSDRRPRPTAMSRARTGRGRRRAHCERPREGCLWTRSDRRGRPFRDLPSRTWPGSSPSSTRRAPRRSPSASSRATDSRVTRTRSTQIGSRERGGLSRMRSSSGSVEYGTERSPGQRSSWSVLSEEVPA